MSITIRFTEAALNDLDGIREYTLSRWGEAQADKYIDQIDQSCARVALGEAVTKSYPGPSGEVLLCLCESHVVCAMKSDEALIVLAVLHQKMDIVRRLADRLHSG